MLASIAEKHQFHQRVFLAPPWSEIYVTDTERKHDFGAAVAEYERLQGAYSSLGYDVNILPKVSVYERADFVLGRLL